jgi:uncharacterized membrane protein
MSSEGWLKDTVVFDVEPSRDFHGVAESAEKRAVSIECAAAAIRRCGNTQRKVVAIIRTGGEGYVRSSPEALQPML